MQLISHFLQRPTEPFSPSQSIIITATHSSDLPLTPPPPPSQRRRLAIIARDRVAVAAPEDAVSDPRVAYEQHRGEEHQTAYGAWLLLQEESYQIEDDEHDVVVQHGRVQRLRNQQNWDQPLQAVHGADLKRGRVLSVVLQEMIIFNRKHDRDFVTTLRPR